MTYRSDLTEHHVLPMLVNPRTANRAGGMVVGVSSRTYLPAAAVKVYSPDVTNKKLSSWSFRPPDVVYSISSPYTTKLPMIPRKHASSHSRSDLAEERPSSSPPSTRPPDAVLRMCWCLCRSSRFTSSRGSSPSVSIRLASPSWSPRSPAPPGRAKSRSAAALPLSSSSRRMAARVAALLLLPSPPPPLACAEAEALPDGPAGGDDDTDGDRPASPARKLTDRGSSLRFRGGLAAPPAVSTLTAFRSFWFSDEDMIVVSAVGGSRQAAARGAEMRGSYLRMREQPENALGLFSDRGSS
jgi:hypothetical protein